MEVFRVVGFFVCFVVLVVGHVSSPGGHGVVFPWSSVSGTPRDVTSVRHIRNCTNNNTTFSNLQTLILGVNLNTGSNFKSTKRNYIFERKKCHISERRELNDNNERPINKNILLQIYRTFLANPV